jgi:hypothetical protein
VVPEDPEEVSRLAREIAQARFAALADWKRELSAWFRAQGLFGGLFTNQMAWALTELEFYYRAMHGELQQVIENAATRWDEDRTMQVHALATSLTHDPQGVVRSLEQTKHGAEYLLSQWRTLAAIIEEKGGLSEPERWFALDLLGVPHSLRRGTTAVPAGNDKLALLDLINCEIVRLQTRLEERLNELDRIERELALQGLAPVPDETTRALQSDIRRAMKRLTWALEQIEQFQWLLPGQPRPSKDGR